MNLSLLVYLLIAFGAFQALFLSLIFLTKKPRNQVKKLFSALLIIEGVTLVERVLAETDLVSITPHLLGVSYPLSFIKPPLLLFMAWGILDKHSQLTRRNLFHFIPFFLILGMNAPFYFLSGKEKVEMVSAFIHYVPEYSSFNFWFFLSFYIYIGCYVILSIDRIDKYRLIIKNNPLANWYQKVLWLYGGALLIGLIYFTISPMELIKAPIINNISMLLMTFFIQSVAYQLLGNNNVLNTGRKRFVSNTDQARIDEERILLKFTQEKVFLDDSMNLNDFSKSLELPSKYISDLINQRLGVSFRDLISQYRVDEAKRIMEAEKDTNTSLLTIGQEAGFNNKVSFYRAFKKQTGLSPSSYYKSHSKIDTTIRQDH